MRTLVAYYSRSGSTAMIAGALAHAAGATLRELVDRAPRAGIVGAALAAICRRPARLAAADFDVSAYDTVILLTPVWAGHPTPAASTFLRRAHLSGKNMLIVTVGAGVENPGAVACLEKMALAAGAALLGIRQVHGMSGSGKAASPSAPEELVQTGTDLAEYLNQAQHQQH